tara:strand:- start:174 stop:1067 length:894 start_codon:yes stop_codon:yes gene_type:complete
MIDKSFNIRPLRTDDIPLVTSWSRKEGFTPGYGDVNIYRHTDNQGLWMGCLDKSPVGCIAGVRYNLEYGFIGLFIVEESQRGNGYGVELWKRALDHLSNVKCVGLEAAPNRVKDYETWGFKQSSLTTRWKLFIQENKFSDLSSDTTKYESLDIIEGCSIPRKIVHIYDAKRETSPRPHFLSDWLNHPSGKVLALIDSTRVCHGFGRIRPCLLKEGEGWRIGPLIADDQYLAEILLRRLISRHPGTVLIDSPGLNPLADNLFTKLGFRDVSKTIRMYKGSQPPLAMSEVYGLACLELG